MSKTIMFFLSFIPISFFVKDKTSKKVILQGPPNRDLYKLVQNRGTDGTSVHTDHSISPVAFLATSGVWHDHLCHVFVPILHEVLSSNSINVIKSS